MNDVRLKWQREKQSCQKTKETDKDIDGLQHEGAMSTKPVFEKIAKTQRSYVLLCEHIIFVLLTLTLAVTIIHKNHDIYNDVNKTSTSVELLAIDILHYMS